MKPMLTGMLLALGLVSAPSFAQTNLVVAMAPAPVLATFDGQYRFLGKLYYAGAPRPREPKCVVALSFMGLDCPPCRREMPLFLDAMRQTATSNAPGRPPVRYFLVSTDPLSKKEALRALLTELKVNLETEVLLDPYRKAAEAFGVNGIPRTFVIAPDGKITADIAGAVEGYREALVKGIEMALGK